MAEMALATPAAETMTRRRVFETWSVEVPEEFEATFVEEGDYWHAYDDSRSVSLTSIVVSDGRRPVMAVELAAKLFQLEGEPVTEMPAGLVGRAAINEAESSARASMALSGLLAVDGRVLIATITSDDVEWSRRVWLSIRRHGMRPPSQRVSG